MGAWDKIQDILYEGTVEQIDNVRCPECGGVLNFAYFPKTKSVHIGCKDCHTVVRSNGVAETPNFAKAV